MKRRVLLSAALGVVLAAGVGVHRLVAEPKSAQLSFLEGHATKTRGGKAPQELKVGSALAAGDIVETQEASRLEIRFSDASVLRLGAASKMQLTEAHFGGGRAKRKMSARLFFGQIWAKVTSVVQGEQKFQIETENAVAGVRGTTFRVDAHEDKSVLVRVYAGAVAVAKPVPLYQSDKKDEERHEVAGPEEVSRDQWEKIVGRQMQIVIGADGTPGDPEQFDEAADKGDSWAQWNEKRDEGGK